MRESYSSGSKPTDAAKIPVTDTKPYRIAIEWPVGRPSPFPKDGRLLTRLYCELTRNVLAEHANDRLFWLTHFASRNRHSARSFDNFHEIAGCVDRAAANAGAWHIEYVSADVDLLLPGIVKAAGARMRRPDRLRAAWRRYKDALKRILLFGIRFVDLLYAIRTVRQLSVSIDDMGVVIVTLIYGDHRKPDPAPLHHRDVYFGDLAEFLAASGHPTLFLGICAQPERSIVQHFVENPDLLRRCCPLILAARMSDVLGAAMRAFTYRPRVSVVSCGDVDVSSLFSRDLRQDYAGIFANEVTYRAAIRFFSLHRPKRIVCVYENNAWERAIYSAARAQKIPVSGYLHCAILRGSLKNYCSAEEWRIRPRPNQIVTTGPGARDLLLSLGEYSPEEIRAGMALRDAPTTNQPPTPLPTPGRVLAMLEGLMSMAPFLAMAHEAAKRRPDLVFVVRAHPDLPAARIAQEAGFAMEQSPLQLSDIRDLRSDIGAADVVLYQGTTAAITAGLLPKPLIRAAIDSRLDDDPLTGIDDLKWQVRSVDELITVLDQALSIDAAEREAATTRRAEAIKLRWAPPDQGRAAVFLPAPAAARDVEISQL